MRRCAGCLSCVSGPDPADPFSRERPAYLPQKQHAATRPFRFAVPYREQLEFFGNGEYAALFSSAVERLEKLGGQKQEIDFGPFLETAKLLYHGPWVAERFAAIKDFLAEKPDALHPVTKRIIEGGSRFSAIDTYESYYQLRTYQQIVRALWRTVDVLLLPTTGTIYTIAEVEADPVQLNTNLGYYTNFVNLLDLCAWAVPNGFLKNGLPMGITLMAPAFQDEYLGGTCRGVSSPVKQYHGSYRMDLAAQQSPRMSSCRTTRTANEWNWPCWGCI